MSNPAFERVAIVNRGEPAMRLIHAVREFNRERGTNLKTIALYTEPDRRAMFVREADEEYSLGSVRFCDPKDGLLKNRYLDYAALRTALIETRAQAAWVGWGFVAEHAAFAELCQELGVVFIGPPPEVIRRLGDKITSKVLAEEAKVPVAPWSGGAVETLEAARAAAEKLGYPLMLKATAGGGGRGIRKLTSEADLAVAFDSARDEALKAFGDGTVFLERMVPAARHVEVQIIADAHGNTWPLGVRDCSVQRKNQKVIEESASTALTPEQDAELRAAAARLAQVVGYVNAGTVEFLYDIAGKRFSFMEVNARLQVEHPVTELATGADLVKLQLHVAMGGRLEGQMPAPRGHAVEVRLCAEDAENGFMPAPGRIEQLRIPVGPGVRVDTGFEEGDVVPPDFDSMMAKIMAWGSTRAEALARLRRVLERSGVVIAGGTTNKGFLLELLRRKEVETGSYDIGWLDREVAAGTHVSRRYADVALLVAAIESYHLQFEAEKSMFFSAAIRGRPKVADTMGHTVELSLQGETYRLDVDRVAEDRFVVRVDGCELEVTDERLSGQERRLTCAGRRYKVLNVRQGSAFLVEVEGVPHRITADSGNTVRAPAPAVVVSVEVTEGQRVEAGDRLAVLEAMKTETTLKAPFAGTVKSILVTSNIQVDAGAPLLQIEPPQDEVKGDTQRVAFGSLCAASRHRTVQDRLRGNLDDLRRLIMGYDVYPKDPQRISKEHEELSEDLPWSEDLTRMEDEILDLFVDLAAPFRRRTDEDGEDRLGPEQSFFALVRDLGAEGAGLPESFMTKIRRALAHYGVTDLTRTRRLEDALFRMSKAQRRAERHLRPIADILNSRLQGIEGVASDEDPAFKERIERLLAGTEHQFPVIHEIVREVRYRHFIQPELEEARRKVHAEAERHLAQLAELEDDAARARIVQAMVASPVALRGFLSRRFEKASPAVRLAMVEVIARSYYRSRPLADVVVEERDGVVVLRGHYTHEGKTVQLIATKATQATLQDALRVAGGLCEAVPSDEDVVLDFYLWRQGVREHPDETQAETLALIGKVDFPRPIRRLVVSVSSLAVAVGKGDVEHYTFRQRKDGTFIEQRLYRGLHPMVGKQLDIWRLSEFDCERLPSAEDVYLFHATARKNPKDERLFALAEVRDLAPERDEGGNIVRLPHVERVLMEALASIRWFQARRPARQRLHWNRVMLFLRPPLGIRPDELNGVVRRMLPEVEGLGLEKVQVMALVKDRRSGAVRERMLEVLYPGRDTTGIRLRFPPRTPLEPLSEYAQKVVKLRQRGLVYPYELVKMLVPAGSSLEDAKLGGRFDEYDLDADGRRLVPVARAPGENEANLVVGVIKNFTTKYPEGMTRVIILGDPSKDMGALAEPECRRVVAALDLAEEHQVPVEWFAVSGGAKISMQSGTENMDWVAYALRRIVEFTQKGGIIHVIVDGVTVGAQPYWNAEATMLMHTKGILVMTPNGSMVLTGKKALDFSGGVSADDNEGIGGFERIMGPNGQAQYFARDIGDALRILLRYYDHSYVAPGERFPRKSASEDPVARDISTYEHGLIDVADFATVGDVFSMEKNPARKKPFDVRKVMRAVTDQDQEPLERWFTQRDAESAVVWDAHLGGYPVCLMGIESRPLPRWSFAAADGPDPWTAGTLFPLSSKKVARALNSASGNRPAVILANLSGFDGSPESMRNLQLEYGAEIGRAVVNFDGPIVFCVISRYHGGAFVVFSAKLNDNMEVAALAGTRASVIGGAPAAAVVFSREVERRTQRDPRVRELTEKLERCTPDERLVLWTRLEEVRVQVHSEKLGEVAEEFDRIHSVERALNVGSIHRILDAADLRPYLVDAVERGMQRTEANRR
ncbi:MAG: DUF2118 domain-containing protein [Myxococcales bacterium]|nr:DUF2118 domain-containing protein [Myxococcales bacterium]MCB9651093.1 DUF2118 domain-containing protein [Deltaproteobacteria bacterium]